MLITSSWKSRAISSARTGWPSMSRAPMRAASSACWSRLPPRLARGHATILMVERGGIPAAAELRDQIHARDQLLALDAQQTDLRGQPRGLRDQQDRIGNDAGLVLIQRQGFRQPGVLDGGLLQLQLLVEHAQAHQIILDRLKSRPHA